MVRGLALGFALAAALATQAWGQQGGQVVQGGATITNPNSTTTQITQTTDRTVINWNSFSIGSGNQVIFSQPSSSSVALNRVVGQDPSVILGHLEANGQVFLLNPNGILFGQTATVNTGGFVASTLSMSDSDFMSGNYHLIQDPTKPLSYVVNQGAINASQYAALVAPLVENSGSISAPGGQIYLLASSEVVLTTNGNSLIGYSIGNVSGGTVVIRPDALSDAVRAVVNTAGLVEAGSVVNNPDGTISLVGAGGTLVNSGILNTKGVDGGSIVLHSAQSNVLTSSSQILSDAGSVELSSGGSFVLEGTFNALSPSGAKGTLNFDPLNVIITPTSPGTYDGSFTLTPTSATLPFGFDPGGTGFVSEGQIHTLSISLLTITIQATNSITFQTVGGHTYFGGGNVLAPPVELVLQAGAGGISSSPTDTINFSGFNLVANRLDLVSSGPVNMGPIIGNEVILQGSGSFNLTAPGNQIGALGANLTGAGNLTLVDSVPLTIANLPFPSGGFAFSSGIGANGITTAGGSVNITVDNAPLTVSAPIITGGGNVNLTVNNNSLTLNAPIDAGAGAVTLVANDLGAGTANLFLDSNVTGNTITAFAGDDLFVFAPITLTAASASLTGQFVEFGNVTVSGDVSVLGSGLFGSVFIYGSNTARSWTVTTDESGFTGNNSITVNGNLTSTVGDINLAAGDNIVIQGSGGTANLISAGNISLQAGYRNVDTVGSILQLSGGAGSTIEANGGAGNLIAVSTSGMTLGVNGGTFVEVGHLTALNLSIGGAAASGNISITNTNILPLQTLSLDDLTGSGFAVENQAGLVTIKTNQDLIVNAPVTTSSIQQFSALNLISTGLDAFLRNFSSITTPAGGGITLEADRMDLAGGFVTTGSTSHFGVLQVQPFTPARPIDLGSTLDPTGSLNLSQAELNTLSSIFLFIGRGGGAGSGQLTISAPLVIAPTVPVGAFSEQLELYSGTGFDIVQTPGSTLSVFFFSFRSGGAVTLTEPGNSVLSVAGTANGSISFTNAGALSTSFFNTSNGLTSVTGDITVQTISGNFTMFSPISAPLGTVTLVAGGTGGIVNGMGGTDITANQIVLEAFGGIGSSNPITVNAANLQALNFGPGNINITGVGGGLTLTDVNPGLSPWSVQTTGTGTISIGTNGPLTVNAPVYANNNISLAAGLNQLPGGNLTINAEVYSQGSGHTLTLTAFNDITLNSGANPGFFGGFVFSDGQLSIEAGFQNSAGAGAVSQVSGLVWSNTQVLAEASAGISLGEGGTFFFAPRLQASNAGLNATGSINVLDQSGSLELVNFTNAANVGVFNGALNGSINITSAGTLTITSPIFAVNSINLNGSVINDSSCIVTINGPIVLNGTDYPTPGGNGTVNLLPGNCFQVMGPADFIEIAVDNNPNTDLGITINSNINVFGRVILLAEGDININGHLVSSATGIIALADWALANPNGVGAVNTNGGILQSNEFTIGAASGININTQSFSPLTPARMQVQNTTSGSIFIFHNGNLDLTDVDVAFDPGTPAFQQASTGFSEVGVTGNFRVLHGASTNDVLSAAELIFTISGNGATFDNLGNILVTNNFFAAEAFNAGNGHLITNDGTIIAGGALLYGNGIGDRLVNNGLIQSTGNSDTTLEVQAAGGVITNNGTIQPTAGGNINLEVFGAGGVITNGVSGILSTPWNVNLDGGGANSFVTNQGLISCNGGTITADRLNLAPGSSLALQGADFYTIQPFSAGRLINLGSAVDTTPNTLEISNAELQTITAPSQFFALTIGSTQAGNITISQPINMGWTAVGNAFPYLRLLTGGNIAQAPAGPLSGVYHLDLVASNGTVILTNPGNNNRFVEGISSGDFDYANIGILSLNASPFLSGVTSTNGNVNISNQGGTIGIDDTISALNGRATIVAGGTGWIGNFIFGNSPPPNIQAQQVVLEAGGGIGNYYIGNGELVINSPQLQAINTGLVGNSNIQILDTSPSGVTLRIIDPSISNTFAVHNSSIGTGQGLGTVQVHSATGPITVADPVQADGGYVWLFAFETPASSNDININANVQGQQVYLWAGDHIVIGASGNPLVLATQGYMEILSAFNDADDVSGVTQLGGTIQSQTAGKTGILTVQSEQGISLGVNGSLKIDQLSLINMGLQVGSNTDIGNVGGNVVVNNTGDLTLISFFGSSLGVLNTATGAGQGNLTITTTGSLKVDAPVFATRQLILQGGTGVVVNQPLESVTGPITIDGVNIPSGTVFGPNAWAGILSPNVTPSLIVIWADNNGNTEQNYTYSGGNLNVPGSVIILSEGAINIPSGTTIRAAGGITLIADWAFALPNGVGAINAGGSTLVADNFLFGAASGINVQTQAYTFGQTSLIQIQNTTSGGITLNHQGTLEFVSLGSAFAPNSPGLLNGAGDVAVTATDSILFDASAKQIGAGQMSFTAGQNILDVDPLHVNAITTPGLVIFNAIGGSIGQSGPNGLVLDGYVDLSLGGTGTVEAQAAGNIFLQEVGAGQALSTSQILLAQTGGAGHLIGLSSLTGDLNVDTGFGGGTANLILQGNNINLSFAGILSAPDRIRMVAAGNITQVVNGQIDTNQLVLAAGGDITLPHTQVSQLQVQSGANVTITNVGDIVLSSIVGGNAVNVTGAFSLTAMSSITVAAPILAGSVSLTADDSISVLPTGPIHATAGSIALTAENGSITINGDSTLGNFLQATGDISLSSGTTMTVSDAAGFPSPHLTLDAGGQINLMSQGETTLQASFVGQNINVQSFGDLTVTGSYASTGGEVDFFTPAVFASNATYSGFSGVRIQGIHGVSLFGDNQGLTLSSGGPVTISADSGPVLIQENVTGISNTLTPSVSITAGTTVDILAPVTAHLGGTGGVSVAAGGTITFNSEIVALGQPVTLTSTSGAIVDASGSTDVVADSLAATAPQGITLNTSINSINASSTAGNITITNQGSLFIDSFSAPVGTATITLISGNLTGSGTLIAQNAILTAPGLIDLTTTVGTLTATSANSSIFITETDDLALKTLSAPGDVVVTAGGAITDAGGVPLNVIASFAELLAGKGIGTFSDPIKTQVPNLLLHNTTSGDVVVVNQGSLSLLTSFNNGGNFSLTNVGGTVKVFGSITAQGNLTISADAGIFLPPFDLTLSAGGNLTLSTGSTGTFSSNSNTFNATAGDITIQAGSGGFSSVGDHFTAGGKITFTSSQALGITGDGVTDTLSANGLINLTSGSDLTLTSAILDAGGQVRLTSGGAITQTGLGSNIVGTSLVAQAVGGIDLSTISVPAVQATNTGSGNIVITSTGPLALSDLEGLGWAIRNSGGDIQVTSQGTITFNSDLAASGHSVTLTSISGAILDASGSVDVFADHLKAIAAQGISLDTVINSIEASSAAGNITIANAGSLVLDSFSAPVGNATITLTGGGATLSGPGTLIAQWATLIAPGGINLNTQVTSLAAQSVNSDITIHQTGSLILDLISAGSGTVTLSSTGPLIDGNGTANNIDAFRAVLTATGGIGSLADPLETTVGHLLLTNTGAGGITLVNTGSLTLEGAQAGTGALTLTVQGGSLTGQGSILAGNGISLTASGDLSLQSSTVQTDGDLTLISGGNLTLVNSNLTSGNLTTLTAAGSIVQTGPLFTSLLSSTELVVTAATGINLPNTAVSVLQATNTLSGNLLIYNLQSVTLSDITNLGWAVNNQGGGVDIEVGFGVLNDLTVSSPVISAGSIHFEADRNLFFDASLTAGTNITLIAHANGLPTSPGSISGDGVITAQSLTLSAFTGIGPLTTSVGSVGATNTGAGDISITNAGTLSVGTVSAANGNVTLTVGSGALIDGNGTGLNVSGNSATLSAPAGINLDTAVNTITASTQNHDIVLRQTGSLALNTLTAGLGNVNLTVIGDVSAAGGGEGPPTNVTASTFTVVATGAIGLGGPLGLQVSAIDLQSTVAGQIDVSNSGSALDILRATTFSGPITITNTGGDLTVNLVQARGSSAGVSLSTDENLIQTPGTSVSATGNVVFTAGGGILLSLVNAGGTASITASGGSILDNDELSGFGDGLNIKTGGNATVTASGTIGTATNCIDVQIGGTLFAGAGASSGGVSINFCGSAAGGAFQIVGPPPPGIIVFNGLTNGLGNNFNGTLDLFNLLESERRFDVYSQYPIVNSEIFIPVPLDDEREKKKGK